MRIQIFQSNFEQARKQRNDALEAMKTADENYWKAQTTPKTEPVVLAYTLWRKEFYLLAYRQTSDVYFRLRDELFEVENA